MIDKNFKKKTSWKNWLIKKLISSEASKEEYRIKKLSKAQKITLTKNYLEFNK